MEDIDFESFSVTEVEEFPETVVRNKEYINLDGSKEEMLFGWIDKIKIIDGRIYVLDKRMRKLLVFDMSGAGIGTVGKRGPGPEEYLNISDFDVNTKGDIYFVDGTHDDDRLFVFDRDLRFVYVKKLPFETDLVKCLPNDKLLFGLAAWNKGMNAPMKIARTDMKLKTEQAWIKYDRDVDVNAWVSDCFFINVKGCIQYNKQIDNLVYEISPEGLLIRAYRFDFGRRNLPDIYRKDIGENWDEVQKYCFLLNFAVITRNHIAGTLQDRQQIKAFIADRNTRKLYTQKNRSTMPNMDIISNMSGYFDDQVISFIYPGKYEDLERTTLPQDVKKHVRDENFTVCLSFLQ
jgi:hypothetical protein